MKGNHLFFIDAETDGLYGAFISAAVVVTDENCQELERKYWGVDIQPADVKSEWVRKNVLPVMGKYEKCRDEQDLLTHVWKLWMQYQESAYAIGDVIFPVEVRLFSKCVEQNCKEREYMGPLPLIDMSSILLAKGIDPMTERKNLVSDIDQGYEHNALYDVETMIELWKKYMGGKMDAADN